MKVDEKTMTGLLQKLDQSGFLDQRVTEGYQRVQCQTQPLLLIPCSGQQRLTVGNNLQGLNKS